MRRRLTDIPDNEKEMLEPGGVLQILTHVKEIQQLHVVFLILGIAVFVRVQKVKMSEWSSREARKSGKADLAEEGVDEGVLGLEVLVDGLSNLGKVGELWFWEVDIMWCCKKRIERSKVRLGFSEEQ